MITDYGYWPIGIGKGGVLNVEGTEKSSTRSDEIIGEILINLDVFPFFVSSRKNSG